MDGVRPLNPVLCGGLSSIQGWKAVYLFLAGRKGGCSVQVGFVAVTYPPCCFPPDKLKRVVLLDTGGGLTPNPPPAPHERVTVARQNRVGVSVLATAQW